MRGYLESSSQPASHYLFESQKIPDRWLIDNTVPRGNLCAVGLIARLQVRARNLGFSQSLSSRCHSERVVYKPPIPTELNSCKKCVSATKGAQSNLKLWQCHRELLRMLCPTNYGYQHNTSRCQREIRTLNLPEKLLSGPAR